MRVSYMSDDATLITALCEMYRSQIPMSVGENPSVCDTFGLDELMETCRIGIGFTAAEHVQSEQWLQFRADRRVGPFRYIFR